MKTDPWEVTLQQEHSLLLDVTVSGVGATSDHTANQARGRRDETTLTASALNPARRWKTGFLDSIDLGRVITDHLLAGRGRHRLDQFAQLRHVVPGVVEVGKIRRPEKFVRSDKIHDVAEGLFVRVARDPALR